MVPTSTGDLTAAEVAQIAALIQAQAQLRRTLQATAVTAATAPLRGFTAFWSTDAINDYISTVLKVVRPVNVRMARTTDAYLARVMTIMAGRRVEPVGAIDVTALRRAVTTRQADAIVEDLPADYDYAPSQPVSQATTTVTATGSGQLTPTPAQAAAGTEATTTKQEPVTHATTAATVAPAQVYGRVFDAARYRITAHGHDLDQARTYASARAAHVAATDVMLADRAQARQTMRVRGVQRYRRVLRPYLGSGGPVCGLCIVASDRTYFVEDLLPIHADCRCAVVPVGSDADPGKTLNRDDLTALYRAAGGNTGRKLKTVRVAITEHGELGPVLSYGHHNQRGLSEVAAVLTSDRETVARAQLASYETQLPAVQDKAAVSGDTRALTWMTGKIDELRAELGIAAVGA